jgi:uncharacterized protein YbcI
MQDRPTKGSIEAAAANAIVRFQREQQGRGSGDVRARMLDDMLVVRSKDIFTQTESRLSSTDDGRKLIKSARLELRSINYREIEDIIQKIVGCRVLRSYFDVDVEAAEQLEVYVFEKDVERLLR